MKKFFAKNYLILISVIFFKKIFLKGNHDIKAEFRKTLVFYFKFLLPMYLVGAAIEAFLTPKVMGLFQ